MKKYTAYALSAIILAIVFYACSSEQNNPSDETNSNFEITNFQKVGEFHNDGLDFIFTESTFNKIERIANSSTQYRTSGIDTLAIAELIIEETNAFIANNPTMVVDGQTITVPKITDIDEFMNVYRYQELEHYDMPIESSPTQTITSIDNKMSEFSLDPSQENFEGKMSTGSVYKHSVEYWSDPNNPLNQYLNGTGYQNRGWFSWTAFAISDVQGAWSGAELGAATGTPAGVIGGAVAFGLCSSALNAAVQATIHAANQ